jgi:hypothetical protein
MLVDVKELFHNRSMRKRTEDFRMEFYIMAAMTSEAMAMYCCRKSQIVKLVNASTCRRKSTRHSAGWHVAVSSGGGWSLTGSRLQGGSVTTN